MLSTFVVNKIDDHCAAAVETTKLENMGLAYGDIITFRQIFDQSSREKTYKERAEELRKKIKRSHTKEKCQTNQTIIQKCLSVNIGLKCVETNQKSKKEKYTLKTNQGYTADVKKLHYVLSYINLLGNTTGSPMEDQPILVYITVRPLK